MKYNLWFRGSHFGAWLLFETFTSKAEAEKLAPLAASVGEYKLLPDGARPGPEDRPDFVKVPRPHAKKSTKPSIDDVKTVHVGRHP